MKGHFTLTAVKANGQGSRTLADFDNLILDSGLNQLCSGTSGDVLDFVRVGSGSAAPVATQSALVSQIAAIQTKYQDYRDYAAQAPYWLRRLVTWRFAQGQASGNIAEVGVGWEQTGSTLFSRALVLDANGNPTTVSVLADEFLEVSYQLLVYPSTNDSLATISINGSSYSIRSRVAQAASTYWRRPLGQLPVLGGPDSYGEVSQGGIGPVTGGITGDVSSASPSFNRPAYEPGSFFTEGDFIFGLTQANLSGGFTAMSIGTSGTWLPYQFEFSPAIPKTGSQVFRLRLRVNFGRA